MPIRFSIVVISFILSQVALVFAQAEEYTTAKGNVGFLSQSSLEVIHAESRELRGIINITNNNFVFAVRITSFDGFNVSLQREHFNENYLESDKFPLATFQGKVIDSYDFENPKGCIVRAKGLLKIHGQEQEKIIKVHLIKKGNTISITSNFSVLLEDYNIKIPRIVHGKIAQTVAVDVNADLVRK
ncbi:MAG TPA: YceI family protein [Bacteroidia bacterium]|nr:YceI family protein [Bacteroidia bacterium]